MIKNKRIGFASEYYTLWSVSQETTFRTVNNVHFASGTETTFTYHQNLSKDLEKAISKAKSMGVTILEVDEELRGKTRSFSSVKNLDDVYSDTQFKFGKYEALQIADCEDVKYLIWYFGETENNAAAEKVVSLDESYSFDGKDLLSAETQLIREAGRAINNGEVVLTAESNLKYDEENDFAKITVSFDLDTEALEAMAYAKYNKWGVSVNVENVLESFKVCKKTFRGCEYHVPDGMRSFKGTKFKLINGKVEII